MSYEYRDRSVSDQPVDEVFGLLPKCREWEFVREIMMQSDNILKAIYSC